jgi:hypothetical protein
VRRYLVYCQGMKLKQQEAQFRHWAEHLGIVRGDVIVHQVTAGLFRPAYLIVRDRQLRQVGEAGQGRLAAAGLLQRGCSPAAPAGAAASASRGCGTRLRSGAPRCLRLPLQVLLVVRGTTSMKDLFTSLSGAVKPHHMLRQNAVVLGYSHLGMLAAARWILKQASVRERAWPWLAGGHLGCTLQHRQHRPALRRCPSSGGGRCPTLPAPPCAGHAHA